MYIDKQPGHATLQDRIPAEAVSRGRLLMSAKRIFRSFRLNNDAFSHRLAAEIGLCRSEDYKYIYIYMQRVLYAPT